MTMMIMSVDIYNCEIVLCLRIGGFGADKYGHTHYLCRAVLGQTESFI